MFGQPAQEELFNRFVFGPDQVADGMSGGQMAEFFSHILDVIAGALQRIRHGEHVETFRPFQTLGIRSLPGGYLWARIHLRVPTTSGPLALAIYPFYWEQYEVFVNGSPVASTPGMATRTIRIGFPFPIVLPRSEDMVVAIPVLFH